MNQVTEEKVRSFLLEHYASAIGAAGLDAAAAQDEFDLLGEGIIDSLGVIEMVSAVERQFGVTVDFEGLDPEHFTMLGPFSRYVAGQVGSNAVAS